MEELLLSLFALDLVLLPGESLPLHIFEERYKTMIAECLAAGTGSNGLEEFGVVRVKEQGIASVGCTAQVVRVTRRYRDGRFDILTRGERRFEILFTDDEKPYLRAGVAFFEDDQGFNRPAEQEAHRALELLEQITRKMSQAGSTISILPPYRHLSFQIAGLLPLDLDFKQSLLAARSEKERLREVINAMQSILPQLERAANARKKADGNGNLWPHR